MARKKPPKEPPAGKPKRRQINYSPSPKLWERIDALCEGMELDPSRLTRLVMVECLHIYEHRLAERRRLEGPAPG